MSTEKLIFSTSEKFKVVSVDRIADLANIYVKSVQERCHCPNCLEPSNGVHSHYTRKIKDLPAFGNRVVIYLKTHKFYCREPECPVKVFTERFADHFFTYKRITDRAERLLITTVIESGAKPTERLAIQMSIPVSDTTLLRWLKRKSMPALKIPVTLGVDDWAYKKRDRYGTVLVNLENRKIIDLLPDRESATLQKWLMDNPGVEIINRDRYGKYLQGATKGAPLAEQVVDRWHLLKNMGEALRKLLEQEYHVLKSIRNQEISSVTRDPKQPPARDRDRESNASDRQKEKFIQVKKLYAEGASIKSISRKFKMHRTTIRKYIALETLPRRYYKLPTQLEKYLPFIIERLNEEPKLLLRQLLEEIRAKGYNGAYSTLSDGLRYYGIKLGKGHICSKTPHLPDIFWRPSKTSYLFFRDTDQLNKGQLTLLKNLCNKSKKLATALKLIRYFRLIMKERRSEELVTWIEMATKSDISELTGFAKGLESDFKAIKNAFKLPWSNGPVEGNVNKLKTIKRQMYGRASFDLLRRRLLLTSNCSTKSG